MKEKIGMLIGFLICLVVIVSFISLYVFILLPDYNRSIIDYAKEHQQTKTGTIILVLPPDVRQEGNVYWEDGSIMGHWKDEDYSIFLHYINKEVTITYGEIGINSGMDSRVLLDIKEV
jgi:hypothetical protein